ncbi:Acyl-CoA N-acyltransferase [Ostreococcus tauri]|uniref:Acyl-CoA N-acyltransferase n=1 Tax=Ostreococcus tauri TaxID=70448 RepID=A0A090M4N7_OSTTA|nr:Acyl-CoA N-acyltransferase [Ostreococcus tauri]CEF99200.1 Acyl-CoA N-acyltransferase [Ostreococcus tauri]|eukprot:XP_022839701.1 Acyl-CoA N-acyltransferase [Ostreococcus tauri]
MRHSSTPHMRASTARARAPPRRHAPSSSSPRIARRSRAVCVARATVEDDKASCVVTQVTGDGDALLTQLRVVASTTARAFDAPSTTNTVLDGLVAKIRWSGAAFVLLRATALDADVAPSDANADVFGCVDVTSLPAFGAKASKEKIVANVPLALGLTEQSYFAYLSGMAVEPERRGRGVGRALLRACDEYCGKMRPKPAVIALHVDEDNVRALRLYERYGYVRVNAREVEDTVGKVGQMFARAFTAGTKKKILMYKRVEMIDDDDDDDGDGGDGDA